MSAPPATHHSIYWHYVESYLWGLSLLAMVALWFFLKSLPGRFRSLLSASWPMIDARIESASVNTFAEQSVAELAYSYRVDGERYSGYFTRQFADAQDAWSYVEPLKGQQIFVRYKPGDPSVSSVRGADQNPLLANRQSSYVVRFFQRSLMHSLGSILWNLPDLLSRRTWCICKGRVELGTVIQKRIRELWYLIPYYVCEVGYSYSVAGEYYSGSLQRTFLRESAAQKFIEDMKGKEVVVRYRADSPGLSSVRPGNEPLASIASVPES